MADLFEQNTEVADQPKGEQQPSQSLFTVGEREYDMEAAKKKIENADSHIMTIQGENADLRRQLEEAQAQLAKSKTVEDALDMLNQQPQQQEVVQPSQSPSPEPQALDMDALMAQAQQKATEAANAAFQQSQLKVAQEANFNDSLSYAKGQFGEEYQSKLIEVGSQVGLDANGINELAKTNPAMFKKLFKSPQAPNTTAPSGRGPRMAPSNKADSDFKQAVNTMLDSDKSWGSDAMVQNLLAAEEAAKKKIRILGD